MGGNETGSRKARAKHRCSLIRPWPDPQRMGSGALTTLPLF